MCRIKTKRIYSAPHDHQMEIDYLLRFTMNLFDNYYFWNDDGKSLSVGVLVTIDTIFRHN